MADQGKFSLGLSNNKTWRSNLSQSKPDLFPALAKGQSPEILWIGCSDSRCPETSLLGLDPGDVFVHRNIANIVHPTDLSVSAVVDYAVIHLKVKHVVLCGHTSCGGVAAALGNSRLGLIDTWLLGLRKLRRENLALLEGLGEKERALKLVELNVRDGVNTLLQNATVIEAVEGRGLKVHGLIYDVGTGAIEEVNINEDSDGGKSRKTAFATS